MRFLIVVYMSLKELPPSISLISVLAENGHDVTVLTFNDSEEYEGFFGENVRIESISHAPVVSRAGSSLTIFARKAKGAYKHFVKRPSELRRFRKRFKELVDELSCFDISETRVWILHEYTAGLLDREIRKTPYYLSVYELPSVLYKKKNSSIKRHIRNAQKVFVAEYNRAKIIEAYAGLSKEPTVLPNKALSLGASSETKGMECAIKAISDAKSEGKTTVLYSGIFLPERRLEAIIEAVQGDPENYALFFMGRRAPYLDKLEATYPGSFTYLGFFNPPNHYLAISNIDIGIIVYEPADPSLNTLFCAPNKIWEYSLYGKPMLVNNIPGLKHTVIDGKFGAVFSTSNKESVLCGLQTIRNNYSEYSLNAFKFYESIDVEDIILSAI